MQSDLTGAQGDKLTDARHLFAPPRIFYLNSVTAFSDLNTNHTTATDVPEAMLEGRW
jgi:hypothetical protein